MEEGASSVNTEGWLFRLVVSSASFVSFYILHGQGFRAESESQALIRVTYPIGYRSLGPTKLASVSDAENHVVGGRAALHLAVGTRLSGEPTCRSCTTPSIGMNNKPFSVPLSWNNATARLGVT